MGVRSDIFNSLKTFLESASLTASDASSSSIPVTIKGVYNDSKDKRSLPVVVINRATPESTGLMAFGDGFESEREPKVMIDIYAQKNTHIDQITDQIDTHFQNNKISELMLIGMNEDDELTQPNDNKAHHKSLFLTFNKWVR